MPGKKDIGPDCAEHDAAAMRFFHGIGYRELRMHKRWLAGVAHRLYGRKGKEKESEHAEGLLSMIDALQDAAGKMFGEERVFGRNRGMRRREKQ